MAAPRDSDLMTLGPWKGGANNLASETNVPAASFRKGVNVDVTDAGKTRRRAGRTLVEAAVEPHSGFGYGTRGFFSQGGQLCVFEVINGLESGVSDIADIDPYARLAHCLIEPDIFVSDGETNLRIGPDSIATPWSIQRGPTPMMTAVAGGTLQTATYHVALAYKAMTGEEGPLGDRIAISIPDGQSISLTFLPATGLRTVVYMTKPNGTELLHLVTAPVGVAAVSIQKQRLGRSPSTMDLDEMPGAAFAAVWKGRLLTGKNQMVVWSEPNQYGLTNLAYNYLPFVEDITMLAAVETASGFFVGQESRTYYVAGDDPADARVVEAYPNGVIPGTMTMIPGARLPLESPPAVPVPMWMATNGVFCVGFPDGTVLPLTETRFVARSGTEGASLFDQRNGLNRFVATVRNPTDNNFAMSDQFTAEVVRNNLAQ